MALPKLMQDIFENNGAGPKFLEEKVPKDFSEAISAPGASFTGNVSAATVNATSLVATEGSELGYTRIRGAGCLFVEGGSVKGLGMSADLPDGTYGGIVSVRNVNDPINPGGICFYTRVPEGGINTNHGMEFHNDGSLRIDSKKVVYVTDTKKSTDWYRKYSDGWIEQGGISAQAGDGSRNIITFATPFSGTNYSVVVAQRGGVEGNYSNGFVVTDITATSMTIVFRTGGNCQVMWHAFGY